MTDELTAIIEELGGESSLGLRVANEDDMNRAIRTGFPHRVVEAFTRSSGLSLSDVAEALDLSLRSLQRRKQEGRLARYESDRIYRLARIVALAVRFLGDHERGLAWLERPNPVLGGARPLSLIDTELGARQVENTLGRIAYGGIS